MKVTPLAIPDILLITPQVHQDERGCFCEVFNLSEFTDLGLPSSFVQDNLVTTHKLGTIRGLHHQAPPFAQSKLIKVLKGAIYDVAVDIRPGSPTFGKWIGVTLTAESHQSFYIPAGFSHGYQTLTDDTEVLYKVSNTYQPSAEQGIAWNDPDLAIDWPHTLAPICSEKDQQQPTFAELMSTLKPLQSVKSSA